VVTSASCKRVASIAFVPNKPIVVEDDKGAKLPQLVALDKDGNQLEPEKTPAVTYTTDPLGFITVETSSGRLLPQKNGETKLRATAEGLPPVDLAVKVNVVDDIKVTCPVSCDLHVGDNVKLDVVATGLGERIANGIIFSSSDPTTATVDDQGTVKAIAAGPVVITAKLGKKQTDAKLEVKHAIDELRVFCPWPPLGVVVKKGGGEGQLNAGDRACEVLEGEDMKLEAQALSKGTPVEGERLEWKSSDPSVRVVANVVTGDKMGGSMIEVHAGDLVAEMPVSVVSAKSTGLGHGHCAEGESAYQDRFDIALTWKNARGENDEKFEYRCASTAGKRCLDEAAAEIARAVDKLPLEGKAASDFGAASLSTRAARCCCRH
jgi:hypothetical protein